MKQDLHLSFGRRISPCKDCQNRKIGCHAGCEKYLAWRASPDSVIAEEDHLADAIIWGYQELKSLKSGLRVGGDWWKK